MRLNYFYLHITLKCDFIFICLPTFKFFNEVFTTASPLDTFINDSFINDSFVNLLGRAVIIDLPANDIWTHIEGSPYFTNLVSDPLDNCLMKRHQLRRF